MDTQRLLKDRRLYVIFGVTLIAVMGVASITPALPKITNHFNLNQTQIALLISVFTFPGIILAPIAGVIADRLGRKTVLVPALFIFAIAGFVIFFVRDYQGILLLRAIQGIGAAPLASINTTLIADFFKGKQRPQVMGYNATVLSLSTAIYPLIGGVLAGTAWYYPFVMPLLAIPVGLILIFGIKEPKIEKPASLKLYFKNVSSNILKKEIIALFILGTLTFIILYGAFITFLPFLLNQTFDFSAPQIGLVLSISSVATAVVASQVGKLTWKYGSLKLLKTAFIFYFAVNILIPNINYIYVLLAPVLLFGAAQALNIPSLQTTLANLTPDNQRGAFMSINGMVVRIGQTLGPLIIGLRYSINGLDGAFYLGAIISFLGLLVLFTMFGKNKTIDTH
jgi:MFS family permease